jgi:hypothetical protein
MATRRLAPTRSHIQLQQPRKLPAALARAAEFLTAERVWLIAAQGYFWTQHLNAALAIRAITSSRVLRFALVSETNTAIAS